MTAFPGAISVDGVELAFPTRGGGRLPVLDGLDLAVAGGEVVALIGPNGSGKSTLLRVIAGLLAAGARGTVTLDGDPITEPDPRIGLVFQEPRLLPWRSAADNITYPLELAGWSRDRGATSGSRHSPTSSRSTRASWAIARPSCRAASGSASRSPGPSRSSPGCCCSTSRSARSMR